jgi:ketosteroid isomerase-like protein
VSQELVEIAERTVDAFNRRDLDAFTRLMTSDIEWFPAMERGLDRTDYRGRQGVATYWANLEDTWDELRFRAQKYRDLNDRVLALGRIEGRGSRGGVPVDAPMGIVFDFRHSEISRARSFLDHGEALKAAGLEPSCQNVEVVRKAHEAFSNPGRGAFDVDTLYRYYADHDLVVDWSRSEGLEAGIYRGEAATRRFWSTFFDAFDRVVVEPLEYIAHGHSVVVPHELRA